MVLQKFFRKFFAATEPYPSNEMEQCSQTNFKRGLGSAGTQRDSGGARRRPAELLAPEGGGARRRGESRFGILVLENVRDTLVRFRDASHTVGETLNLP